MKTTNGEGQVFPWFLMNSYFLMTDDNSMAFRQEHQYTHKDSHPVKEALQQYEANLSSFYF
jgi:hypothetical protein